MDGWMGDGGCALRIHDPGDLHIDRLDLQGRRCRFLTQEPADCRRQERMGRRAIKNTANLTKSWALNLDAAGVYVPAMESGHANTARPVLEDALNTIAQSILSARTSTGRNLKLVQARGVLNIILTKNQSVSLPINQVRAKWCAVLLGGLPNSMIAGSDKATGIEA